MSNCFKDFRKQFEELCFNARIYNIFYVDEALSLLRCFEEFGDFFLENLVITEDVFHSPLDMHLPIHVRGIFRAVGDKI